jgi:hypothetical protein
MNRYSTVRTGAALCLLGLAASPLAYAQSVPD